MEQIKIFFKDLKFKKIIYPMILGIFIIGVIIIFVYSARFLVKSMDKSLSLDIQYAESHIIKINFEKFYRVAGKLGIEIKQPAADSEQPISDNQQQTTDNKPTTYDDLQLTTTTPEITANVPELDKKAVKISILNSTKIKGLAGELKTILENDGFIVGSIGNYEPIQEKTFIKIKESKNEYALIIKEAIAKKYQLEDDQQLPESEIYDIIILIGNK